MRLSTLLLVFCICTLLLFGISPIYAGILTTDNFDNPAPSDWDCSDGAYEPWDWDDSADSACTTGATVGGVTHKATEMGSPGRGGSGNSWRHYKATGIWSGYHGNINLDPSEDQYPIRKVYHRFYWKIPSDWNWCKATAQESKLGRYYIRATDAGSFITDPKDTLRIGWYGGTSDTGVCPGGQPYKASGAFLRTYWDLVDFGWSITGWYEFSGGRVYFEDYNDDQWHSWEFMLDIQSNQVILQLWIDGVSKGTVTRSGSYNSGTYPNLTIRWLGGFAQGNLTDGIWDFPNDNSWHYMEFDDFVASTTYIGPDDVTPPPPPPPSGTLLFEDWEQNNLNNWDDDFIQGDTTIDTNPVYADSYAVKQRSSNAGNLVHFFGDHPGVDQDMVTDVTVEAYIYPDPSFSWPSSDMKLWIMNSFESWSANYTLAEGRGKPHKWAPYYMTISVDGSGQPFGQLTRADGLGGAGDLWHNFWQNVGSPVALTPGAWNKIKFRLKLNSLGAADGIFQLWVNDELKCDYSNMNFRGTYSDYGWNHLMMSMHASPSHPQSQWISRDNISLISGAGDTGGLPPAPTGLRILSP